MYQITYTTKIKPTDLPKGATVTELPLQLILDDGEEFILYSDGSIFVGNREDRVYTSCLPKADARELIDGLLKYVGEPSLDELKGSEPDRPIQVGDTVQLSQKGRDTWANWPDSGRVVAVDPACFAGLPYRVDFGLGYGQVWVRAVEVERARG